MSDSVNRLAKARKAAWGRKTRSLGLILTVHPGRLSYIIDSSCSQCFLVYTGSMLLITPWMSEKAQACQAQAGAASPAQQWTFLLALVSFPIIGPDLSIFTEIMDSW
jgi:hypothetical protein